MTRRLRVLHVIPSLGVRTGGPPVAVVESALALRPLGVESTIFATDQAAPAASSENRAVTDADLPRGADELDVRLFPATRPSRLAYAPGLARALADEARRADVMHVHSLFLYPQFAAFHAARAAGLPYLVSPRGALDPFLRRNWRLRKLIAGRIFQSAMLDRASLLHVTARDEEAQLTGVAAGVPRAVVANGVDWCRYQSLPSATTFRTRLGIPLGSPLVLYHGRIAPKKGLDVLVRAFAVVQQDVPEAHLAIAGPDDGAIGDSLRLLARCEGVGEAVSFAGMLTGDDKLAALVAADVWALPSHGENFGNALVEAMASGRACVTTPQVNIAQEIVAGGAARVVERTPEAFAAAIVELLRDDGARALLGERARTYARRYDWTAVAPELKRMYERAVGSAA
jgi:glycosyltransferase involved in cell wall biosynthesis